MFAFIGTVKLTPEQIFGKIAKDYPKLKLTEKVTLMQFMSENANAMGTVWNSWQTTWAGEPTTVVSSEVSATSNGSWSGDPSQGGEWVAGLRDY